MGKNFMGYNNASELITAIGNKIKAKYTKPSGGIPKSDLATAVQTSLGKADNAVQPATMTEALAAKQNSLSETQLAAVNSGINSTKVAQISTNQTNILYVADSIDKNQLDTSLDTLKAINTAGTWNGNVCTYSVGSVTVNSDGTLTVKKTSTASRLLFYLTKNDGSSTPTSGTKYAGCVLSGCPSGGSENTYSQHGEQSQSPWGYVAAEYGNGYTILTSSLPVYFYIVLNEAYTTPSEGLTFKPMICTAEAWNISHEFAPYALPNSDLTYLEAEDRAALADEIDAGAKNKVNIADVTTTGSSFVLDHVAISLLAGSYTFSYTSNQSISGDIELILRNGTTVLADHTTTSKSGRIEIPFTLASAANNITLYSVRAGTYSDFMICTKAAFGVSNKFVPYKGNFITVPVSKNVRYNCTSTDYEHVTALDFAVPSNTYAKVTASLKFSNGAPRGIKIIDTAITNPTNAIVAINESTENYGGITASCLLFNAGTVKTYAVYTKSASVSGNDVIITLEYLS